MTENKKIQIDLGCGPAASAGFLGVDRFIFPGVGIVADLNQPLPLADNTVDLLFASHSLEHVEDLFFTMSEIYRVCKHGAQICIIAPYYQQSLNFANPYHKQVFNEHTPRFWTNYHNVAIEKAEYEHVASNLWGLAESDNSTAQIDLRILKMEFFYYEEYKKKSPHEQRIARKKYLDVCDQIKYNLVVIKKSISDDEMAGFSATMQIYDPAYIIHRKLEDQREKFEEQLAIYHRILQDTQQVLTRVEEDITNTKSKPGLLKMSSYYDINELATILRAQLEKQNDLHWQQQIDNIEAFGLFEKEVMEIRSNVNLLNSRSLNIANELEAMRSRSAYKTTTRFEKVDYLNVAKQNFQRLVNDSFVFQNVGGFLLQPSLNLEKIEFVSYKIELKRSGLCGVWIAPIFDIPLQQGMIGFELVSPENVIVLNTVSPINGTKANTPLRFIFEPVSSTNVGIWGMRIFSRNLIAPVRILEWHRHSWGGLGKTESRAFFGFDFS